MNKYPVLFEELFVFKGSSLTTEAVVSHLMFPTCMDKEEKRVDGFLTEFLMASPQDTLKMFLTFVTSAPCLPYFGLQTLSVKFSDQSSDLSLLPLVCVRLHCEKCLSMKIILSCLLRQFCKHVESHLIVFKTYYSNFFKCYSCSNMTSFCDLSAHIETSTVVTERKLIPFQI